METLRFNPAIAFKIRSLSSLPIIFESPYLVVFADETRLTSVETEDEWVKITYYENGRFCDTEYFENTERGFQIHEDLKAQESEPQDSAWDFHQTACFRLWAILNSPA